MWLLAVYCVLVAAAALAGGHLPSLTRLSHTPMQLLLSYVGGLMLGVAILHLLPHSVIASRSLDISSVAAIAGLLTMFFLIRVFHLHQHGPGPCGHDHERPHRDEHEHAEHCEDSHHRGHAPQDSGAGWVGLFLGLSLHTLIDGAALAASVAAAQRQDPATRWAGMATFLAVLVHKPFDALSITSVMLARGWSLGWRTAVNLAFGLMCPLGAVLFQLGVDDLSSAHPWLIGASLGFAAGVFLCIALADILPEVQFHSHDRIKLSVLLLAGVLTAWAIGQVESHDAHRLPPPTVPVVR